MALNKVEICGVNTARLPLLKNEEKEALFERIKEGDSEARELYIKGNLRLVLSVIRRFGSSSENADDLFQIGCIGLMKAIDNFDSTLNVKFSTYAVPMIIGEIRRYLRDNNSIRVSRSLRDTAYKAIYAREGYVKKNLKEPTITEIAEEIGIPKEEIVYAMDAIQTPMSLYDPVYTEGGDTLYVMDQISDGPRAAYHPASFLRGKDPDGGGASHPDLPGPGEPPRKKRSENAEKLPAIKSSESSQNLPDFFIV